MNNALPFCDIGGEFHWMRLPQGPFTKWPQPHIWFALGREALLAVWRKNLINNPEATLLIPDYFCPEVIGFWNRLGIKIQHYTDDPRRAYPDWDTLLPKPGDVILAVNYFGVRDGVDWKRWYRENNFVVLVEDHTHDPLCNWALNSKADYAFASIRKTFPVTDGAILWSPKKLKLPEAPQNKNGAGSALKLAAMILKSEYLNDAQGKKIVKDAFRRFQIDGERLLTVNNGLDISPWSRFILEYGIPKKWRQKREDNVSYFIKLFENNKNYELLFRRWPKDHCPYNVVLVFTSEYLRNRYRKYLISKNVYVSVHWDLETTSPPYAMELSKRTLTIPVDQRYDLSDIERIVSILETVSC